jgi:Fe-S cluster assembly iron-binding protein IscA
MINISETAQAHFCKLLANQEPDTNIRVFVVAPAHPVQNAAYLTVHLMRLKNQTLCWNLMVLMQSLI